MTKIIDAEYKKWLSDLKERFLKAQVKAAVKVNTTLLKYYWELGADIVARQEGAAWGSGFLKQLSQDLQSEFPSIKGFSVANLKHIRNWWYTYNRKWITTCYPNDQNSGNLSRADSGSLSDLCAIPWGHNILIISKCKSLTEALFYVKNTIKHGWSRAVLTLQIESNLYAREGKAVTNFHNHLPNTNSDLAQQILKDPYDFEFLTLTKDFKERELEQGLIEHMEKFLLELGSGFAFVGRQYELTLGKQDFYCDLLFYHLDLRCFVVIDLKAGAFKPEYAGKMNFYCNVIDDQLKKESDTPTIGMILCKEKERIVVEFALKNVETPMGVSKFQITESLPDKLKSSLPSVEEIEAEFQKR